MEEAVASEPDACDKIASYFQWCGVTGVRFTRLGKRLPFAHFPDKSNKQRDEREYM